MAKADYLAFLESPEWWATRKLALQRANYECQRCGARGPLEVHHQTYLRLGDELVSDLEVLCSPCHRAERLPHNKRKLALERYGQLRLFDRWKEFDYEWRKAS